MPSIRWVTKFYRISRQNHICKCDYCTTSFIFKDNEDLDKQAQEHLEKNHLRIIEE